MSPPWVIRWCREQAALQTLHSLLEPSPADDAPVTDAELDALLTSIFAEDPDPTGEVRCSLYSTPSLSHDEGDHALAFVAFKLGRFRHEEKGLPPEAIAELDRRFSAPLKSVKKRYRAGGTLILAAEVLPHEPPADWQDLEHTPARRQLVWLGRLVAEAATNRQSLADQRPSDPEQPPKAP